MMPCCFGFHKNCIFLRDLLFLRISGSHDRRVVTVLIFSCLRRSPNGRLVEFRKLGTQAELPQCIVFILNFVNVRQIKSVGEDRNMVIVIKRRKCKEKMKVALLNVTFT